MASLHWFFVVALAIVAFSEARFHRKFHQSYHLKQKGKEKNVQETDQWVYVDDDDAYCGKDGLSKKEQEILHQRKKMRHSLPFTAYIVRQFRHQYIPICVATILPDADDDSSSILLTLTTCIESGANLPFYKVYIGDQLPVSFNHAADLYDIEEVAIDKKSPNLQLPNAMVIRLNSSIPVGKYRQPVCLPKPKEELPENTECILSVIRSDGKQVPYLIDVQSKSNRYCKQMAGEDVLIDTKLEICGLDYREGSFISKGGPMICKNKENKWTQYGIYAHASHIRDKMADKASKSRLQVKARPGVYVSVANFRKLMQDAQNLQTLSRINLMKMR